LSTPPRVGFKTLVSAGSHADKASFHPTGSLPALEFYKPPKAGYRAVYVYQVTLEHNLFGWLYNDGMDDRSHTLLPLLLLSRATEHSPTGKYFTCLQRGPVGLIEAKFSIFSRSYSFPNLSYLPARKGLEIP